MWKYLKDKHRIYSTLLNILIKHLPFKYGTQKLHFLDEAFSVLIMQKSHVTDIYLICLKVKDILYNEKARVFS